MSLLISPNSITSNLITDSTTVGQNLVKLANPGAITFLRTNVDNSISALSAVDFRTAISAQITLVSGTNIKTINGQDILTSGDLLISVNVDGGFAASIFATTQLINGGTANG